MARMKPVYRTIRKAADAAVPFNEKLQKHKDEYVQETGKALFTTIELARWAISTGRWDPPPDLALRKCREDYAKAMRSESIKGPDGKPVRVNQAAKKRQGDEQMTFWGDIRTISRGHFGMARAQRREQIVGECRQLDRDERFYNTLHTDEQPFETLFDMTDDVIEGRFSGTMDTSKSDHDPDSDAD